MFVGFTAIQSCYLMPHDYCMCLLMVSVMKSYSVAYLRSVSIESFCRLVTSLVVTLFLSVL